MNQEYKIYKITYFLMAVNVITYLYTSLKYGLSMSAMQGIQAGGFNPLYVYYYHEYYRLITSVFMHFGISHIMNNMLILFILGDNLERALGHIKYLFFYLICGVGANIVSMAVNLGEYRNVVSAGASGAIFGVIGGLLYAVIINRGRLEDLSTRQLVVMIVCSLYFGFTSTGVDNAAHIAGLLIGIVMGILLYRKPRKKRNTEIWG